ncbi:hypothetical protein GGQ88_003757 [Novosphingobium hassiacum]|uniref:Curlin n=1 Tax=Novosphingobium hassiacum TaxID=173676 RepID=A0A7W6EXN0_9SPHN|nr:hypothetical protein [Novosphingobium hassiacum]MBB3862456.1 hypothetical protein [Novosphingobium hassiacum]
MSYPATGGRTAVAVLCALALASPALANNYGESAAWQFRTSADRANQAAILDLIEKRRAGGYANPTYTTTIERQYNCGVTATATGNAGTQTALAHSPTTTGSVADAQGNASDSIVDGGSGSNGQSNSGVVSASISGGTSVAVDGAAWQALNSTQTNSGAQSVSVAGSTGCTFGALN